MAVSAPGSIQPGGFHDRLGDRTVVPQPAGTLLEQFALHDSLSRETFVEPLVRERMARLTNLRTTAFCRVRRAYRATALDGGRFTLVTAHVPGHRLAELLDASSHAGLSVPVPAVTWFTGHLLAVVALLHDFAPDLFHGALGPERIILTPDGRTLVSETVLGTALEQAAREWGGARLWRTCRVALPADPTWPHIGRQADLLQIGMVALALLLGRRFRIDEVLEGLPAALDEAMCRVSAAAGGAASSPLRGWLERILMLEPPGTAFRSVVDAQKALASAVDGPHAIVPSAEAWEAFCRDARALPPFDADVEPVPEAAGPETCLDRGPEPRVEWAAAELTAPAPVADEVVLTPAAVSVEPVLATPTPDAGDGVAESRSDEQQAEPAAGTAQRADEDHEKPDAPWEPVRSEADIESRPAAAAPFRPDLSEDPFGPWPVPIPSRSAATLLDAFQSEVPARPALGDVLVAVPDTPPRRDRMPMPERERASAPEPAGEPDPESRPGRRAAGLTTDAAETDRAGVSDTALGAETPGAADRVVANPAAAAPPTSVAASVLMASSATPPDLASRPAASPRDLPTRDPWNEPQARPVNLESQPFDSRDLGRSVGFEAPSRTTTDGRFEEEPRPAKPVVPRDERIGAALHSGRRRHVAIAISLLVVASVAAVAAPRIWARVYGGAAVTGHLRIESEPARADVSVDGEMRGQTPLLLTLSAGPHQLEVSSGGSAVTKTLIIEGGQASVERVSLPQAAELGGLKISTYPMTGRLIVDGVPRGQTPARVADLSPGVHVVVVETALGRQEQDVLVEPGRFATLSIPTAAWVKAPAPFELKMYESGRLVGTTGTSPVMVPPGNHHFEFVSQAVGLKLRQFVEVPPGQLVVVPLDLPTGMMNLFADQTADVFLDGQLIGQTPLSSVSAALGSHEVIFRHVKYGEVRYTVMVTMAAPVSITVNFRKK